MKSERSFCNISPVLVKRNLRQFWLIPLAAFLVYFFKGALPLIVQSASYYSLYDGLERILTNRDYVYLAVLMALPVCAAVAVFSYLHGSTSATAIHAMPFSRKKLYRSAVASGMIMITVPILLMGIALTFILQGKVFENLDAAAYIPYWTVQSLITVFYVYAVSVLAAMVAGTVVTHILLSLFFNGMIPITTYIVGKFMTGFLFGYSQAPLDSSSFSPVSLTWSSFNRFDYGPEALRYLAYVLITVLLLYGSGAVYRRISLEKEGNATVFSWVGEIVCYLFAFICTTALSYFILDMGGRSMRIPMFAAGAFISSIFFYTAARMILEKTTKVLHSRLFKGYAVLLASLILFFSLTVFDLTGYAKNIPDADSVDSIQISDSYQAIEQSYFSYSSKSVLTEDENIRKFIRFHHLLTEHRGKFDPSDSDTDSFVITYHLKGGGTLMREYLVSLKEKENLISAYNKVFGCREYKKRVEDVNKLPDTALNFSLVDERTGKTLKKFPNTFRDEFNAALAEDIDKMTLSDLFSHRNREKRGDSLYLSFTEKYDGADENTDPSSFYIYEDLYPNVANLVAEKSR